MLDINRNASTGIVHRNIDLDGKRLGTIFQNVGAGSYDIQHDRTLVTFIDDSLKKPDLSRIFTEIHAELPGALPDVDVRESGTTALVAVCGRDGNVTVASLGDCRATLYIYHPYSGRVRGIRCSKDHSPDDPEEQKRIKESGGLIINEFGPPRMGKNLVDGSMSLTAAFGDYILDGIIGRIPRILTLNLHDAPILLEDEEIPFLVSESDGAVNEIPTPTRIQLLESFLSEEKKSWQAKQNSKQSPDTYDYAKTKNSFVIGPESYNTPEDFVPNTEAIARHFNEIALRKGSRDNISVVVTHVGVITHIAGVFDGHGTNGYRVAEKVRDLFEKKLQMAQGLTH